MSSGFVMCVFAVLLIAALSSHSRQRFPKLPPRRNQWDDMNAELMRRRLWKR